VKKARTYLMLKLI